MPIPSSQRPVARADQIRDMGTAVVSGHCIIVCARGGERMEWQRIAGTEYFERIDPGAPVAPLGSVMHADPRESPPLELTGERHGG